MKNVDFHTTNALLIDNIIGNIQNNEALLKLPNWPQVKGGRYTKKFIEKEIYGQRNPQIDLQ